jgi:hypothetical protein
VTEFLKQTKQRKITSGLPEINIIHLGKHRQLKTFCESLLLLFDNKQPEHSTIKPKLFKPFNILLNLIKTFLAFLSENSKPIKIDLYEFMIHIAVYNYSVDELARLTARSLSAFKRFYLGF